MFLSFDDTPLGAASLAQVHKAVLRDGRTVAVKVQHPKVQAQSSKDILLMEVRAFLLPSLHPHSMFPWDLGSLWGRVWASETQSERGELEITKVSWQHCDPGTGWLIFDSFLGIVWILSWELCVDGLRTCGQLLGPRRPGSGGECCGNEVTQISNFLGGRKSYILIWSIITNGSMWSAKEFEHDTEIT